MRKVICSIGAGRHAELLELSGETMRVFASRHGYAVDLRTDVLAPERPASWSKVKLAQELLEDHDVVLWVDADAAIVDASRDILDEVGRGKDIGLVAHEYDGQRIPNCGVMVLRRSRRLRRFLDAVWAQTQYLDHVWWENAAVLDLLGYRVPADPTAPDAEPVELVKPSRMCRRVEHLDRAWNSIMVDEAGAPRIRHYPGRSHEYRLDHLRADLDTLRASGLA